MCIYLLFVLFFFNDTATTEIYTYLHTLSLHYALPILVRLPSRRSHRGASGTEYGSFHSSVRIQLLPHPAPQAVLEPHVATFRRGRITYAAYPAYPRFCYRRKGRNKVRRGDQTGRVAGRERVWQTGVATVGDTPY